MKTKILITTLTIVVAASMAPNTARASMMCQHDWLAAWANHSGALPDARVTFMGFEQPELNNTNGARGIWAISSTLGGAGRQTVVGISACTNTTTVHQHSGPASPGDYCHCTVISPTITGIWSPTPFSPGQPPGTCSGNCHYLCAEAFRTNLHMRRMGIAS